MKARIGKSPDEQRVVRTPEGLTGRAAGMPGREGRALVTFDDGRAIVIPDELLEPQSDGSYLLDVRAEQLREFKGEQARDVDGDDYTVIPVIREELDIQKRTVETGRGVRIHKKVSERVEEVVQLLYREQLDVQHVPVNRLIDGPLPVRYEGTTMVIPLCEEVLVLEKRLLLKEEVRVTRKEGQVRHAENVVLRTEHASVERFGDEEAEVPEASGTGAARKRAPRTGSPRTGRT